MSKAVKSFVHNGETFIVSRCGHFLIYNGGVYSLTMFKPEIQEKAKQAFER